MTQKQLDGWERMNIRASEPIRANVPGGDGRVSDRASRGARGDDEIHFGVGRDDAGKVHISEVNYDRIIARDRAQEWEMRRRAINERWWRSV